MYGCVFYILELLLIKILPIDTKFIEIHESCVQGLQTRSVTILNQYKMSFAVFMESSLL